MLKEVYKLNWSFTMYKMHKAQYNNLKKACRINDIIFKEITSNFCFKREIDLKHYILSRFQDYGATSSYPVIVAHNNHIVHAKPRKVKFSRGFCVLDFGAKVNGYCSDMTRTIFIGKANKKEKSLYQLIKNCQEKCVRKVKVGASCFAIDKYSRELLGGYKKYYIHGLGHGVGKHIHTRPKLSPRFNDFLKEGDFITIEPGIYISNKKERFGIRIEDTLLVTKKGYRILTKSPRSLIEINQ